jgi:predicted RNA-binding protein YlxR (DUF448 family)
MSESGPTSSTTVQRREPQRTCVGCRERSDRHSLRRMVLVAAESPSGVPRVEFDPRAQRPGRGAWIHPRTECFARAEQRRAIPRAFRLTGTLDLEPVRRAIALEAGHEDPAAPQGGRSSGQHQESPEQAGVAATERVEKR